MDCSQVTVHGVLQTCILQRPADPAPARTPSARPFHLPPRIHRRPAPAELLSRKEGKVQRDPNAYRKGGSSAQAQLLHGEPEMGGARSDHAHLLARGAPPSCQGTGSSQLFPRFRTLPYQSQARSTSSLGTEPAQLLPRFQAPPISSTKAQQPPPHPAHILSMSDSYFPQAGSPAIKAALPHYRIHSRTDTLHPPFRLRPAPPGWSLSGVNPLTPHLQLTLLRMMGRWPIIHSAITFQSSIHSFIHTFLPIFSLIRSSIVSHIHTFVLSNTPLLMFSFTHSLNNFLTTHSLTRLFMGKCIGSLLPSSTQASSLPFTPPAYLSIHLFASLQWLSSLTPNLNPRPASPLSTYGTDLDLTCWGLGPPHMHNGFHIYFPDTAPEGCAEAEQNAPPCTTRLVHHAYTIKTVFHSSGTWIWARAQLPGWVIGIRSTESADCNPCFHLRGVRAFVCFA